MEDIGVIVPALNSRLGHAVRMSCYRSYASFNYLTPSIAYEPPTS
jgi:hypothetical protein